MQNTQSCLVALEALSSETSSDKRRIVLRRVTDLFFMTHDRQTLDDINTFGTVMERIAYELEVEARAELSERICEFDKSPRQLITRLANDDIAIARPILEHSRALSDDDLVRIARTKGQNHLHAIAKRDVLAPPVTDIIVKRGVDQVLVEITRNHGAEFSHQGLVALADKARANGNLLTALGARKDLQPEFMVKIKKRVAQRMKAGLAGKYPGDDMANLDSLIDESAANLDLEGVKKSNDELRSRARKHELSEDDIIRLARAQRLPETVHALSVLTGLDDQMISHCLLNADIAAIGILCKANNFNNSTYLSLVQTRAKSESIPARDIIQAMREYDLLNVANAKRTLRFLKIRGGAIDGAQSSPLPEGQNLWHAHDALSGEAEPLQVERNAR